MKRMNALTEKKHGDDQTALIADLQSENAEIRSAAA